MTDTRTRPPLSTVLTATGRESLGRRTRLAWTLGVVAALHVAAALLLAAGGALSGASGALTLGAVGVAYLAGLKHHADADHLTGIAGATRSFVARGKDPVSVGLAFSLGHSSVVFVMACALIVGIGGARELLAGESTAAGALGVTGGLVAGTFLVLVGAFNLVALVRSVRARRAGHGHDGTVHDGSAHGGPAATVMGRLMAAPLSRVRGPRHVYVIGFLFGLGFDTATQIGLLVLTASSAALGAPAAALLALPVAFAAGMTLGDTLVGYVLVRTYARAGGGRAAGGRVDVVVTAMAVASALSLGTVLLAATSAEAGWTSGPLSTGAAGLDLDHVGWVVLGVVAVTAIAVLLLTSTRSASR